jgi:NAD(P)-dependent dehydrogenase (short-subunit alcohol dehydrogenase family)
LTVDPDTFAIVVGGSRGLGADVARALHESGADVVVVSRRPAEERPPWREAHLDATDCSAVDGFFDAHREFLRSRNYLVNFAGTRYNEPIVSSNPEHWKECVEASLMSTYTMTRAFARTSAGLPGVIVNMASIHAWAAAEGRSAYAAAKAAVCQLTAISAVELAKAGIRVNCIAPGFIGTEASAAMIASGKLDGKAIEKRTPLGRLGATNDITDVVMFLLSDESRFLTGETIRIDGGWLRHAEV